MKHCLLLLTLLLYSFPALHAQETSKEWSQFLGPDFDFTYQMPQGVKPAVRAKDLRHRWDSEAMVGATGLSRQQMPSGGAATPIVYQNRIYLWYFTPNISEGLFDPDPSTRKVPDEFRSFGTLYRVVDNAISADQQILCIDADTGKTLWRRSFPATGLVQNGHKDGLNNMTMAAGEGKVYAFGSGRFIYCLDAESGALIWRVPHINYVGFQKQRVKQQSEGRQFKRSRDGNNYLVLVDGVLVSGGNDNGSGMAAYDAKTGERLWSVHGWLSSRASAKVWMHLGKAYLLAAAPGKVGLIEPRTGEFLWKLTEGMAAPGAGVSIQDDYLFTSRGEPKPSEVTSGRLACYKLSLEAPELMWEAPEEDGFPTAKNQGVFLHEGKVFMRSMTYVQVYDLETGKKLNSIKIYDGSAKSDDTAIVFRINNLLYQVVDSQHLHYPTVVVDMETQKIVGKFTIHHPGISYSSQMMPVFHGENMILRRGYCRISTFHFIQQDEKGLEVKIEEPIQVVAKDEPAAFTATVKGEAKVVRFMLDGKEIARDTEAPYVFEIKRSEVGTHQVQVVAEGSNGEKATSYQKLLKVLDWDVILLPQQATLEINQKRRFIPLTVNADTGELLPQKFQAVRMSHSLDNTWPTPYQKPSKAMEKEWRERVKFQADQGEVSEELPSDEEGSQTRWGTYSSAQAGKHEINASFTLNGVTRSARSKVHIRAADERLPLRIKYIEPFQTFIMGKSGSIRPVAATDVAKASWPGLKQSGIKFSIESDNLVDRKTKFTPTKPGFAVIKVTHPGTDRFLPAEPVMARYLVITDKQERKSLNIDFPEISSLAPQTQSLTIRATSPSEEPVSLSVISGPATLIQEGDEAIVTLTGKPGIVTVIAEHHGDMSYNAALPVVREFEVK